MTAYTDLFNVAIDSLASTLSTATGLRVVTDSRDINPPCVFIDTPNFEAYNYNIARMEFSVKIISLGPANSDALRSILNMCAQVLGANVAVTRGTPTTITGATGQDFPAFDLTVEMKVQTS